jgi:GH25 family lysozyme M1 (1,4-beta-N-acetylmuramidase)
MSAIRLAVDVSNYSGPISPEQARCLRQAGVEHLIAGTQVASICRQQLEAALEAGLTIDAYVYLHWRRDVVAEVQSARGTLAGLQVGRLWLDCEDDPAGLSAAEVVGRVGAALEACGPAACGIYTGRWWWLPGTGNSTEFAGLPLWHAEYTFSPEARPDFDAFQSYGGWTRPSMWQFQGTTQVCGLSVDLDLLDIARPPAAADNSVELALLRAGSRFDRARALGRYLFRPYGADGSSVELQRVEGGRGVSFDPPYVISVD